VRDRFRKIRQDQHRPTGGHGGDHRRGGGPSPSSASAAAAAAAASIPVGPSGYALPVLYSAINAHMRGSVAQSTASPAGDGGPSIDVSRLYLHFMTEGSLSEAQAHHIIARATRVFRAEPAHMGPIRGDVTVVTDVHGQFFDLPMVFKSGGGFAPSRTRDGDSDGEIPAKYVVPKEGPAFLFLGDYVDRGRHSCEVILFLLALKCQDPGRITLLRGNHESRAQNVRCGTEAECIAKYSRDMFEELMEAFEAMPVAATIEVGSRKIFCVHGGISPDILHVADINKLGKDRSSTCVFFFFFFFFENFFFFFFF
jgi:predicted phosphodiesterase